MVDSFVYSADKACDYVQHAFSTDLND